MIRPHEKKSRELSRGAGRGLEGGCAHTGDRTEFLFEGDHDLQPALAERRRRAGVNGVETRVGRHGVTELWVVLHGARTKRVHAEVDGVLAVREASEVSD